MRTSPFQWVQPFPGHLQLQPVSGVGGLQSTSGPAQPVPLPLSPGLTGTLNRNWAVLSCGLRGGLAELGQPSPQVPSVSRGPERRPAMGHVTVDRQVTLAGSDLLPEDTIPWCQPRGGWLCSQEAL